MSTKYSRACAFCLKVPAKSKCARCEAAYYCNVECQRGHWKTHKAWCNTATGVGYGETIKIAKNQVRDYKDDARMSKVDRLMRASCAGLNTVVRSLIVEGVNVNHRDPTAANEHPKVVLPHNLRHLKLAEAVQSSLN